MEIPQPKSRVDSLVQAPEHALHDIRNDAPRSDSGLKNYWFWLCRNVPASFAVQRNAPGSAGLAQVCPGWQDDGVLVPLQQ
jgi:hypothetical protein